MSRFPRRVEVWSRSGKRVARLADLPLQEEVPIAFGSVPTGPRSFDWRSDAPATVYWAEALDGGDARRKASLRDRVFVYAAPFRGKPRRLVDLALRFGGVTWGSGELALVSEWWWPTRKTRTWIVAPDEPSARRVLFDRSFEDRYSDPGRPVTETNKWGHSVIKTGSSGGVMFLSGRGASAEGDRPFVDELTIATGRTRRLWRSEAPHFEQPIEVLDAAGRRLLTRRESKTTPPDYYVRDLDRGSLTRVTRFPHPHPELTGIKKELIRYKRDDGVMLTATLYLPRNHNKRKGRLPVVMWAYPREFKSADAAGQVTDSPHRFARVAWYSPVLWVTRGYAVLEGPTMPIVGEGQTEPNDTFVKQLVASAKAAIDEVHRRGVGDRNRVAIGGHSYGAFMTANLLAHSDLFRAGIARSGAYNRTLTPFGFQSEERSVWEAPDVYFAMSPFMHAAKIDEPLLLIHGAADNNPGTFPMQSERLYNAVKGLGGTARLVMLPHESHGYRARESVLHMLWETERWLETHVKPRARSKAKRQGKRGPKRGKKR